MNRHILFFLAVSALLLSSCRREEIMGVVPSSGDQMKYVSVNFSNADTKCEESHGEEFLGETMIETEAGDTLYISAYLSDMEEPEQTVETKSTLINGNGTAAYNTFGTAEGYSSFLLNVYKEGESTIYNSIDKKKIPTPMENVPVSYIGGSTDYKWSFGSNAWYWPKDGKLNFCSYGPSSEFGSSGSVSNVKWDKDSHTFSFDYATPSDTTGKKCAENQKDIIVGVNQQAYKEDGTNNIILSLKHPLMAVRFVLGDIFGKIEYISLNNFYTKGTAAITNSGVSWTNLTEIKSFYQTFDMFDATVKHDTTGTVSLDTTSVKKRNFIIIPQTLCDSAMMKVKLGSTLHPETLNFSKMCKDGLTLDWTGYAGKVLTFRIGSKKANLVSVDITDEVNQSTRTKQNIRIVNDGKSPIYIRAVLVGNWLNGNGNVLAPWSEKDPHGDFDNSFPNTLPENWTYNESDGFYYYKKIIMSGHTISQNLFNTFTLRKKPVVTTSSQDTLLIVRSFELDIQVQAVSADTNQKSLLDVAKMARTAWKIADGDVSTYFTSDKE